MSKSAEWFEAFFGGLYGRVLAKAFTPERTLQQAAVVRRLLRLRKGRRVLDIPCGMGRLAVPLAKAGLVMTGVDLIAGYLRRARREAAAQCLRIRFLQCDMRRIEFDGEFDAAFNWFTSIGYFCDEDELAFCRRVLRALKPGGLFLVETLNKSWVLPRFSPRGKQTVGGVEVTHRNRFDPATSRTHDTWIFRRGRKIERHRISIRLYGGTEMRRLLAAAGFRDIRLYATPAPGQRTPPGPLTRHSRRLIAVARRPGDGR